MVRHAHEVRDKAPMTPRARLNDDIAEKSSRRKQHADSSRQSLQTVAQDTITRMRTPHKQSPDSSVSSGSAPTPRRGSGSLVTPTRRTSGRLVPVQADFDQWMSLIRSNRINAANSWNFPLIDYFHDLSILRDGNSINFQRASYTLDGCVKVYTSRVDSVSTETNKLLTGLVAQKVMTEDEEKADESHDPNDSDVEEEVQKKRTRRARKVASNLVNPEKLRFNVDELANTIDPLFRKMCADFDEGGAKGLLLNSLIADGDGRLAFDGESESVDDEDGDEPDIQNIVGDKRPQVLNTIMEEEEQDDEEPQGSHAAEQQDAEMADVSCGSAEPTTPPASPNDLIDMALYKVKFFAADADMFEGLEVCPSLPLIKAAIRDPQAGTESLVRDIEAWSLGDLSQALPDIEDDHDELNDDLETPLWYNAPAVGDDTAGETSFFETSQWDVMAYFDERYTGNWAGPEHWKVQRLKSKRAENQRSESREPQDGAVTLKKGRKPKPPFTIDFSSPLSSAELKNLFTPGKALNLPKGKLNGTYYLPDDVHYTAKNIVRLFLRPEGRPAPCFTRLRLGRTSAPEQTRDMDAEENANNEFWAQLETPDEPPAATYDADFFQEPSPADAELDNFLEDPGTPDSNSEQTALTQLTRRSDQLNFAKTARKVNVRLLKSNMWRAMTTSAETHPDEQSQKLSEIVELTGEKYRPAQKADLTPSLYFINLLHLANEHGLELANTAGYRDIEVRPIAGPLTDEAMDVDTDGA